MNKTLRHQKRHLGCNSFSSSRMLALTMLAFLFLTHPVLIFAQNTNTAENSNSGQVIASSTQSTSTNGTVGTQNTNPPDSGNNTQETNPSPTQEGKLDEEEASENESETETEEEKPTEELEKPMQLGLLSADMPTSPEVSGLKNEFSTKTQTNVDQSTGALIYEYPIKLPEGRAGMTPELSVKYNSRNIGRPDSLLGLGWEISLPYIVREPIKGTNSLYSQAFFSSSLSGNLIATTDTSSSQYTLYRPESDNGEYLKYNFNTDNTWTMTGKDGKTYTFGGTSASRQDNPSDTAKIYKWMISKIADKNGNEINYSYIKNSGQIYPSQILYTHHASSPAVHKVDFNYTTPPEYGSTVYNSAFPVTTSRLLDSIVVTTTIGPDTTTDTYNFGYENAQFIKQKNLTSISRDYRFAQSHLNQNFNDTTSFTYSTKNPGWEAGTHSLENAFALYDDTTYQDIYTADFDLNGYMDVLKSNKIGNNYNNHFMMNTGSTFVDSTSAWGLPTNVDYSYSYAIVDLNGDRLPDLSPRQDSTLPTYINTGSGFTANTSGIWLMMNYVPEVTACGPNLGDHRSFDSNVFFYDINNDGKNDILYFGGSSDFRLYLNNGNGFTVSSSYTFTPDTGANFIISNLCSGDIDADKYQILTDINGDGLEDYYHQQYGTYLNTGSGFKYSSLYTIFIQEMDRSNFSDLNGDGLLDYLGSSWYGDTNICTRVFMNDGAGFIQINPTTFPPCTNSDIWHPGELNYYTNHSEYWGSLVDVTADGYSDIVAWNNGSRFNDGKVRAISNGISAWLQNPDPNIGGQDYWTQFIVPAHGKFFDINADGILDYITPDPNFSGGSIVTTKVGIGKPVVPNRLTKIRSALGAETLVEYSTAPTNYDDTNISPMSVVKKITVKNIGLGQPDMVSQYEYKKGVYITDPATGQRRFTGFHKVTATESGSDLTPLRISETYFHQANGSDAGTNEPADTNLALIGRPYYSVVRNPGNTLKKEIWNKYNTHTLAVEPVIGRFSKFVFLKETIARTTEPGGVTSTADVYTFDTTLGEQTELRNMGFVTVGTGGTYTDIAGDTRYRFTEYANNPNSTIVKPKRIDTRTGPLTGTTLSRTDYIYDNLALGSIGDLGNLTKEIKWIAGNGTTLANTSYTYDTFGNVLTVTNPKNAITTYTYDNTQSQIASERNHLNQTTNYEYITGKLSKVTDINGRATTYRYSTKGWLFNTIVFNTGGNPFNEQYLEQQYNNEQTGNIWSIRSSSQPVDGSYDISWQILDRLGRPVRTIRKLTNHDTEVLGDLYLKQTQNYDALGREVSVSTPANISTPGWENGPLINATIPSHFTTTTVYDIFDRPTSVTNALGTTALSYAGTETTTTDANGKQKKVKTDAYGNIIQVKEINGASTYTTLYTYDNRNLLIKLTDALGNIRNFTYNNIGWLTASYDLRAVADTTFGVTYFQYDLNGNQTLEIRPSGTSIANTYDVLDRLTSTSGSTTTPIDYTLVYDTCINGKGRLCTVNGVMPGNVTLKKSYVYGISGVPTNTAITTLGNTYTTNYEYTYGDQVKKITYPNGTSVRYAFGNWALPSAVYTTLPGGTEAMFATTTYNTNEQPLATTVTNGPTITNTYDETKLFRKTNVTATQGGNTLQSFGYTYDNTNNITQILEPAITKTYTYDDLYRLTAATYTPTSGTPTTHTYTYNAIGNILTANGLVYAYSAINKTNPHAVTSIGANTYTYDINGNMITAPGQALTYNWQNQPTRITLNGTTNIDAYYDESGERFIYKTPTNTEIQVEETYLVRNNIPEIGIKLAGMSVGTIVNNIRYSSITDHLGTTVKQISSEGTTVEDVAYDPFGKIISQTGTINSKRGYTGHEEDTDTGLVYAEARYYNPGIMRFSQQDKSHIYLAHPAFKSIIGIDRNMILLDPQQLNSYSYVRNNPINLTDPTGNRSVKETVKALGSNIKSWFTKNVKPIPTSTGVMHGPERPQKNKENNYKQILSKDSWTSQFSLPNSNTACFRACNQIAGYTPSIENSINTLQYNKNGNLEVLSTGKNGIDVIDNYLSAGKPIIVGVNRDSRDVGNFNKATNHFVVISGYGYENGLKYYGFFDPGTSDLNKGTSSNNKLYLNTDNYSLSGRSEYSLKNYLVTEVRPE